MYTVLYLCITLCILLYKALSISSQHQNSPTIFVWPRTHVFAASFIRVKPWFSLSLGKQLLMAPLKMGIFMQCSQCSLMAEYLRSTEVLTHPPALRPQTHTANRDHPLPSITCWAPTTRPALGSLGRAEHLEKSPVRWKMGK